MKWILTGRIKAPLFLVLLSLALSAHVDDPKTRDRQPPYPGPGFRSELETKAAVDFPSQGIRFHSWISLGEFGANIQWASDSWGYVSPSGREYALICLSDGVGFVEITNAGNPQIVAVLPSPQSPWRDIKVFDEFAYSVNESGGGIQVFDLRRIDEGLVQALPNVTSGGGGTTHNVVINEDSGYLYRCGGDSNGLRIYSLEDPSQPLYLNGWDDRYVHDAQIVTFMQGPYAGREIAFCCGGFNGGNVMTGLTIIDVTDKQNLRELAHLEHSNGAYSHQGWLSKDRHYFFLGDESDENAFGFNTRTIILDVSDLNHPREVGAFSSGLAAIDHNLYVKGDLIYEANYRSGLRVFDAANPLAPREIAFFDTYPPDDNDRFNGLWNSYPFFPSGLIIGSDVEKGLFVWSLEPKQQRLVQLRLLFPWISNSDRFESRLLVQNYGDQPVEVLLHARREDPDEETLSTIHTIEARGFLDRKAADLFPDLGLGPGYSVVVESAATHLRARWITNDRASLSPSQGLAVPIPDGEAVNDRLGPVIEFGFLPGGLGFQSAPVLVPTGTAPTDVTVYYFDRRGFLVATDVLDQLPPLRPVVPRFIDENTRDVYAVAVSNGGNLTGAVFVFNDQGQTAIGNTSRLDDFLIP